MTDQFVTYEIALKLKELGFSKQCLAEYLITPTHAPMLVFPDFWNDQPAPHAYSTEPAPLWQQAIAWVKQNTKVAVQERLDGWYVVRKNSGFEVNNKPLTLEQAILLALQD